LFMEEKNEKQALDIFATSEEYLPRLAKGLAAIAELIQSGQEAEASGYFVQAVEGLRWLALVLQKLNSQLLYQGSQRSLNEEIEKLGEILSSLLNAWENSDYVLISDLLEYELAPFVQLIKDEIIGTKQNYFQDETE